MIAEVAVQPSGPRELVIARKIAAPALALYRCWTEPELLVQWFAPRPLTTEVLEMDVRPGGAQRILMRSPDGQEYPAGGVYLETTPGRRLVFTDAYRAGWVPAEKPLFTGVVTFEDLDDGQTLYTARARHWTEEAAREHEAMGFAQGWGICAAQLAEVARTI